MKYLFKIFVFHLRNLDALGIKEGKVFIMQNLLNKEQLILISILLLILISILISLVAKTYVFATNETYMMFLMKFTTYKNLPIKNLIDFVN